MTLGIPTHDHLVSSIELLSRRIATKLNGPFPLDRDFREVHLCQIVLGRLYGQQSFHHAGHGWGVTEDLAGAVLELELELVAVAVVVRVAFRSLVFDTGYDLENTQGVEGLEQKEAYSRLVEYWNQEGLAFYTSERFLGDLQKEC